MKNFTILIISLVAFSCAQSNQSEAETTVDSLRYDNEVHLKNIRQLTWGGNNAEAYWSFDDSKLIFQANVEAWGTSCDQIFIYDLEKKKDIMSAPPDAQHWQG